MLYEVPAHSKVHEVRMGKYKPPMIRDRPDPTGQALQRKQRCSVPQHDDKWKRMLKTE